MRNNFKDIIKFTTEGSMATISTTSSHVVWPNFDSDKNIGFGRYMQEVQQGVYNNYLEKFNVNPSSSYSSVGYLDITIEDFKTLLDITKYNIKHNENNIASYSRYFPKANGIEAFKYCLYLCERHRLCEFEGALKEVLEGRQTSVYINNTQVFRDTFINGTRKASSKNKDKYQYPLSSKGTNNINLIGRMPSSVIVLNLAISKEKAIPKTKTSVDLYSNYQKDLGNYKVIYDRLYTGNTIDTQLKLSYISKYLVEHRGSYLDDMTKAFNKLKANLMLWGSTEEEAVNIILKDSGNTSPVHICSITKQILPEFLVLNVFDTYISMYYIALYSKISANKTMGGSSSYIVYERSGSNGVIRELLLNMPSEDCARQAIQKDHKFNPLTYLTPKAMPNECIKVSTDFSVYSPVPYLGIELEVEQAANWRPEGVNIVMHKVNITDEVLESLGKDYVILKYDGSLRGHYPFEIVTVPATLAYHKSRWKNFLSSDIKSNLKSFTTDTCGMHVHISRNSFTGLHLAKFMRFINLLENKHFVETVAQRANNRYSPYQDMPLKEHLYNLDGKITGDRRQAVNCTNKDTVEVRIFKGNLATIGFLKNIEFVHSVHAYTKDCSITELNYKKYLSWLLNPHKDDSNYSNLRLWLIKKGFSIDNITVKRDTPPDLAQKLIVKRKEVKEIKTIINTKYAKKRFDKDITKHEELEKLILSSH